MQAQYMLYMLFMLIQYKTNDLDYPPSYDWQSTQGCPVLCKNINQLTTQPTRNNQLGIYLTQIIVTPIKAQIINNCTAFFIKHYNQSRSNIF